MIAVAASRKRASRSCKKGLSKQSPADRKLYESIPEVVDYVPHPDYPSAEAEQELFGPEAEVIPVARWQPFPEVDEGEAVSRKARRQLSRRQEALLFMRHNYAKYRLAGLMSAQKKRFLTKRVPEILMWYGRALDSRAALASANMALVVAMAKRTRINAAEFGDLVSEGNMALLRAIDKFDVRRGFKFSTYACRAILKAFHRLATKIGTYRQRFPTEYDPEMEASDEVERRHVDQRDRAIEDVQRVLIRNIAQLSDVERTVVGARFAVDGHREARTLEQVGKMVGLSKERVRQVQNEALEKLRATLAEVAR